MIYKNILVAVDESNTSTLALKEAIKFALEQPQTFLRFVHIGDEFFINWDGQPIAPEIMQESIKSAGLALLQNIEAELRNAKISNYDTRLVETKKFGSRIAEKIIEEAKALPADLIIVGTHGRRGFHHFLLGSVAEEVVRIACVPVLLVRGK